MEGKQASILKAKAGGLKLSGKSTKLQIGDIDKLFDQVSKKQKDTKGKVRDPSAASKCGHCIQNAAFYWSRRVVGLASNTQGQPTSSKPSKREGKGKSGKGVDNQNTGSSKRLEGTKDDLFGDAKAARKRTEDGLAIYTEQELGLDKQGGGTELCPFDCTCCY